MEVIDVDYKKILISDVATDGGMGNKWEEIDGNTRQGTATLTGSDASVTAHKNVHGETLKSSQVAGDKSFNFQCADISAENRVKLMGGSIEITAQGTNYKAPSTNQSIRKSIMLIGTDGSIDYAPNARLDVYMVRADADLAYLQVNCMIEKPEKEGVEEMGSWDNDVDLSANDILSFVLDEQDAAATIDAVAHTVDIDVAIGTDVTALVPNITASIGAIVSPNSLEAQNFTAPVVYTVKSAEDTEQEWTVTVTVLT